MLDGLTLALWGAFGDGATHEDDELLDAGALEVPEVAHVQSVRQNHRIRTLTGAFQHQQSCDLHISLSLLSFYNSTSLSLSLSLSLSPLSKALVLRVLFLDSESVIDESWNVQEEMEFKTTIAILCGRAYMRIVKLL